MKNLNDLENIFIEIFELESNHDISKLSNATQKNWDSMMQVNLIVAVESEFNISIDPDDYEQFTSFENIHQIIKKY
jgi:acyl carrier protein